MGILFDGIEISPGKSEISQFDVNFVSAVDQDILWFEIPVNDSVGMAVLKCE